jgi:hypothetical protein
LPYYCGVQAKKPVVNNPILSIQMPIEYHQN